MNEVDLLRRFGEALRPEDAEPPAELAQRTLSRLDRSGSSRAPAWARRPGTRLVLSGALAAVLAGFLYVLVAQPTQHGGPSPVAGGDARQILHEAAMVSQMGGGTTPKPGQFVFIETANHYTMQMRRDGRQTKVDQGVQIRQTWLSVDGSVAGRFRTRPAADPSGWSDAVRLDPGRPGYRSDLPTDADAMFDWLYANSHGDNQRDEQAFITAVDLEGSGYLPPKVQAALFDAVARIPGITVLPDVTDLLGRPGVGIGMGHLDPSHPASGRSQPDLSNALIFDPDSHVYLGSGRAALLREAFVDGAGILP